MNVVKELIKLIDYCDNHFDKNIELCQKANESFRKGYCIGNSHAYNDVRNKLYRLQDKLKEEQKHTVTQKNVRKAPARNPNRK